MGRGGSLDLEHSFKSVTYWPTLLKKSPFITIWLNPTFEAASSSRREVTSGEARLVQLRPSLYFEPFLVCILLKETPCNFIIDWKYDGQGEGMFISKAILYFAMKLFFKFPKMIVVAFRDNKKMEI